MDKLNDKEKTILLSRSRKVLDENVKKGKILTDLSSNEKFLEKRGVFVSLHKKGQLRGCIGNFEPAPLWDQIRRLTVETATADPRFSPVQKEELEDIKIEISILSPLEKTKWQDVDPQKDGVLIEIFGRRGTFLPQVGQETGWNKEELLAQLCQNKIGVDPLAYKDPEAKIYKYQVEIIKED